MKKNLKVLTTTAVAVVAMASLSAWWWKCDFCYDS